MALGGGTLVAPSVLASDYLHVADDLASAEAAGADWHHVDIMDGHFVPNISFGPDFQRSLQKAARLPLDTHLMLSRPLDFIDRFAKAGSAGITVHVEADAPARAIARVRELGLRPGISLRPGTPPEALEPFLAGVGLVLVMTVEPGYGGQAFMPGMLPKIRRLAELRAGRGLSYLIEVDGGINEETGRACAQAGADVLVAGSSVYGAADRTAVVAALRGTRRC